MSKTTRSRDGHVMGNPPEWVAEKLLAALDRLVGPFTRARAREVLMEEGVAKEEADAMTHALCRVPGVSQEEKEEPSQQYPAGLVLYRRPALYERNVRHRAWRITPRRLNIEDAARLAEVLRKSRANTPGLEALREQLEKAVEGLV